MMTCINQLLPEHRSLLFTKRQHSRLVQIKAFADDKINVTEYSKIVLGNEENAGYHHFLLSPQCFPKGSSTW